MSKQSHFAVSLAKEDMRMHLLTCHGFPPDSTGAGIPGKGIKKDENPHLCDLLLSAAFAAPLMFLEIMFRSRANF